MDIKDFFDENNKVAIGFSGGVDSSCLLYLAKKYGADVKAYYVKTQFQPQFELEDAKRIAAELNIDMEIIYYDILQHGIIAENTQNRCYYCKRKIFEAIKSKALKDGFNIILDGTNASDKTDDRPGMKALCELSIKSPLRACGLTKADVREISKRAGLFTYNKPAYACLATRVNTGDIITEDKLSRIEKSEGVLYNMGFSDMRVRMKENCARLQFRDYDINKAFVMKSKIYDNIKPYFYDVIFDDKPREKRE